MSKHQEKEIDQFSEIFKALSNANRLRIFLRLVDCCGAGTVHTLDEEAGKAYVGELAQDLDIVPSTVSHHIKELREAGLIRMERKGQNVECWIDQAVLGDLEHFFSKKT